MLAFYAKQAMGHVVGPKRRAEEVERLGLALVRSMARNGRDGTTAGCSREEVTSSIVWQCLIVIIK